MADRVVEAERERIADLYLQAGLVLEIRIFGAAFHEEAFVDQRRGGELVLVVEGTAENHVFIGFAGEAQFRLPQAGADPAIELRLLGCDEVIAITSRGGRLVGEIGEEVVLVAQRAKQEAAFVERVIALSAASS